MNCRRCHNPIPPEQLVCLCFQKFADEEAERLALRRFISGETCLYLADTGHLVIARGPNELTLCRKTRVQATLAKSEVITRDTVKQTPRWCSHCYEKAITALSDGAALAGGGGL